MPLPVILENIIFISRILKALVILIVVAIMVAVGYVLARMYYPRPALLSHSEDLKKFMKSYVEDVKTTSKELLIHLRKNPLPKGLKLPSSPMLDSIRDDDITFFFMFYEYHTAVAKGLDRAWWFLKNEKFIIPKSVSNALKLDLLDGTMRNVDDKKMEKYVNEKMKPLRSLAVIAKKLSEHFAKDGNSSITSQPNLRMHAFRLDILLNEYRGPLSFMNDTRKTYGFVLQFNIFRLYLTDFADTIFNRKIKRDTWGNFLSEVGQAANAFTATYRSWQSYVMELPFTLSDVDASDKRNDVEISKVEGSSVADSNKPSSRPIIDKHIDKIPDNDEVVIEEFKQLIDPVIDIMKFFVKAIIAIPKLIKLVFKILALISDPPKFIQAVLGLIIGIVLVIVYFIGLILITPLSWIVAFVFIFVISVFFTVLWFAVFIVVFILFLILWVLDLFTGGQVLRFLRCENLPDAWMYQPQFSQNNKFERSFFCSRPCFQGFKPSQLFCKKCSGTEPNFCPQQLINQSYEGKDSKAFTLPSKYLYKFTPGLAFWTKTDQEKKRELRAFEKERSSYLTACYKSYADRDPMTKTICANVGLNFANKPELQKKVVRLCDQIYCDYGHKAGHRSVYKREEQNKELFCKQYVDIPEDNGAEEPPMENIVSRTMKISVGSIVLICVLVSLLLVGSNIVLKNSSTADPFETLKGVGETLKPGNIGNKLKTLTGNIKSKFKDLKINLPSLKK